jgi:large subunit ribosomal protein L13
MIGTKTYQPKAHEIEERWLLIDATDEVLGRLASRIAGVLRGKDKPDFAPHVDPRTHCVVINAEKIKMTGSKWKTKKYYKHSGWVGGLRELRAEELHAKRPEKIIEIAVKRMLPKNKLSNKIITHLHVYAGDQHPHAAQKPQPITLTKSRSEDK